MVAANADAGAAAGVSLRLNLPSLPQGWLGFCLRTWLSIVFALAIAFWLELPSSDSAAVCAAILAQPLRGQALSKSIYRFGATLLGAAVSVALVACFPQQRFLLLGGAALWLALCVAAGTLERNFRSYGAMLSGYTVAIVAVAEIDSPQSVFTDAVGRVAVIAVGVFASTVVNDLFAAPQARAKLLVGLDDAIAKVRGIALDAMRRQRPGDGPATAEAAGQVIGLAAQADFARPELEDGAARAAAANSAVLGLLDVLSASRAVASVLDSHDVSGALRARVAALHDLAEPSAARDVPEDEAARAARLGRVRDALDAMPWPTTPAEAFVLDRLDTLFAQARWIAEGRRAVAEGGRPGRAPRLGRHRDMFAAGLNAVRILIAFGLAATLCILSGLSDTTLMLVNVAAICALSSTNANPTAFGLSVLIGGPLAVLFGGIADYLLLTHGNALPLLALALLPPVAIGCLLSLYPRTASVGFIAMVWSLIALNPANPQQYDPTAFAERGILLLVSSAIVFLSLGLVLPLDPHRRRLRLLGAAVTDVTRRLEGRGGKPDRVAMTGRHYDRLSQALQWSQFLPDAPMRRRVLRRLIGLGDLDGALARLAPEDIARRDPAHWLERARSLLADPVPDDIEARWMLLRRAAALYDAARLLSAQRRYLVATGEWPAVS